MSIISYTLTEEQELLEKRNQEVVDLTQQQIVEPMYNSQKQPG
jgi:hypothetical protein